MPVTKSAQKALRSDRRRAMINQPIKSRAKAALSAARRRPTSQTLSQAFSALDKAVKHHVFKKGKVDRLKQRLSKLLNKPGVASLKKTTTRSRKPKKVITT